ncbi:MAG: DUF4097 and DUF4098 domain-containing protein YvlB [Bacillariaceae sp.]|jgi:DUF4097 and DUF4098 domain-containing protein YvlB
MIFTTTTPKILGFPQEQNKTMSNKKENTKTVRFRSAHFKKNPTLSTFTTKDKSALWYSQKDIRKMRIESQAGVTSFAFIIHRMMVNIHQRKMLKLNRL